MAPRLAVEEFQDMNHEDMDVTAPPSGPNFHKEHEVARLLDDYLGQLIAEGFFDDCDLREPATEESDADDDYGYVNSAGSSNTRQTSSSKGSKESLTDRFKRYIRRILPLGKSDGPPKRPPSSGLSDPPRQSPQAHVHQHDHDHENNHKEASKSHSRERSGSEPLDPKANYGHAYKTKYPRNEVASGYTASGSYSDADASADYFDDEDDEDEDYDEEDEEFDEDDDERNSHGLSDNFRQDPEVESVAGRRSRTGTRSRAQSRTRSQTRSRTRSRSQSQSSTRRGR